ncbi:MAG: hypothetical protein WC348_03600 [Patescibacteria group bacterium]|jgi:hypothetical protein
MEVLLYYLENLEKIKSAMAAEGAEKLHILSDFDRRSGDGFY